MRNHLPKRPDLQEPGELLVDFYLGGRVALDRNAAVPEPGFTLIIELPADRRALAHLEGFCSGQERARRFPTSLSCKVRVRSEKIAARIRDVSLTGAFVRTRSILCVKTGATVDLELREGFLGLWTRHIKAHVVWRGEKDGSPGFGAEFFDSPTQVLELVRKHGPRPGRR